MSDERSGAHNRFAGTADAVAQAGVIHGGVHFHRPGPPKEPPRELPSPPAHYTNCDRQLAELTGCCTGRQDRGPSVAIVVGAPGSGRSGLVITWAHRHRDEFPDGQILIRLGAADRDEAVWVALGNLLVRLGFAPAEIPDTLDGRIARWRAWSAGKRILLVIDDALTAGQVRQLLPGEGRSAVLVVEAGRLTGLRADIHPVEVRIDPLEEGPARLLLSRIIGPDRVAAEPEAVTALLARCGGTALALCVVGAMLAESTRWTIARLVDRLADDERVLPELSRHEDISLTVVFDAAYRRLDPLAGACYRLLGAHPGGGDVALETLAALLGEPVPDVDHACGSLLRAMLVTETADDRYLMSGLPRHHARAVAAGDDGERVRRAVLDHYRDRALAAAQAWMPGRPWLRELWPDAEVDTGGFDAASARRWMEAERVNLRAVTEDASAFGALSSVCRLAVALWPLHDQGKYALDMRAVNDLGVRAARELGDPAVASVLGSQRGYAERQLGRPERAGESFASAVDDAARAGSRTAEATALEGLGLVRRDQGREAEAARLLARTVALADGIGDPRRIAMARFHHGTVAQPPTAGLALLDRARAGLAGFAEDQGSDESYTLAKIDLWRGRRLAEAKRAAEADAALAAADQACARGGWRFEHAQVQEAMADVAQGRGDPAATRRHLEKATALYRSGGFAAREREVRRRAAGLT